MDDSKESSLMNLSPEAWDNIDKNLSEQYADMVNKEFGDNDLVRSLLSSMEVSAITSQPIGEIDQGEQRGFWADTFQTLNASLQKMLIEDYSVSLDIAEHTTVVQISQRSLQKIASLRRCCRWIDCDGDGTVDTRACG